MKYTSIALGFALVSSLALGQSEDGEASPSASAHKNTMLNELDLSPEQREKIREIRASGGGKGEVRAVLTDEQQVKFRQLKASGKSQSEQRARRMREHLDLSDDQVEQIRSIRQTGGAREEVRAVLNEEQQAKFDAVRKRHKTD